MTGSFHADGVELLYHYIFVLKVFLGPQSRDVESAQFYAFFVSVYLYNNVREGLPIDEADKQITLFIN